MEFLKKITIYVALLSIFLLVKTPVFAEGLELSIKNFSNQDGLSFSHPLPDGLSIQSSTVHFHTFKKIDFEEEPEEVKPTIKPKQTRTPTLKLSFTPTPTKILTPTLTPQSGEARSGSARQLSNGGLNADTLFDMSNSYRQSKGLSTFQKDDRVCQLAVARAPEISAEIAENRMHSGKNSHNFPYWFTENIITMRSEQEAFNWWIQDEIHRIQIEADNKYSCVACSGFTCTQEFTNFQPK